MFRNQFFLNTHEDWGQTLEESMSSNLEPNKEFGLFEFVQD